MKRCFELLMFLCSSVIAIAQNNLPPALNEKSKNPGDFQNPPGLHPHENSSYVPSVSTVTIVTKKLNDKIEIKAVDNGNDIPQNMIDRIFQPFFTTKPTGQGTGLGLSLAYDISKAHGREIKVETKANEGLEFTIQLPA
jgi:light-regulated signal transduction histidine kinase (bacteriophytochrome)